MTLKEVELQSRLLTLQAQTTRLFVLNNKLVVALESFLSGLRAEVASTVSPEEFDAVFSEVYELIKEAKKV